MAIKYEEEMTADMSIDESNLIGELKNIKNLLYKWNTRLATSVNKLKKIKIEIDRLRLEKMKFYKHDYEEVLRDSEVRVYIDGDTEMIERRNERREIETRVDMFKTAVYTIREKSKTVRELIELQKLEML